MLKIKKPIQSIRIPVKDEETGEPLFVFRAELHLSEPNLVGHQVEQWQWKTFPVPEEIFEAETGIEAFMNPLKRQALNVHEARKIILMAIVEFKASGAGRFYYFKNTGAHPN